MALSIETSFKKEIHSSKSLEDVKSYFKDPSKALGSNFPGLESLLPVGDQYAWKFEKLAYSGYELVIEFTTTISWAGNKLSVRPVNQKGHKLSADWEFEESGGKTKVQMNIVFTLEVPVPSLMRAMVEPLAKKELTKLLEKFSDNLGRAIA